MINTIYVENEIKDHSRTLSILSKFKRSRIIYINKYSEIFNKKKQSFRLQKKDPNMPLESIYENQQNILNLIKQYKEDIKQSEQIIASAVNTLEFQTIPLSRSVEDDEEILAFVNKSVETCNALAPKTSKSKKVNRKKNASTFR